MLFILILLLNMITVVKSPRLLDRLSGKRSYAFNAWEGVVGRKSIKIWGERVAILRNFNLKVRGVNWLVL